VELLPADWPGFAARELFAAVQARLVVPARVFATGLLDAAR
jgi:DNA-binding transcriptional regulator PaaX